MAKKCEEDGLFAQLTKQSKCGPRVYPKASREQTLKTLAGNYEDNLDIKTTDTSDCAPGSSQPQIIVKTNARLDSLEGTTNDHRSANYYRRFIRDRRQTTGSFDLTSADQNAEFISSNRKEVEDLLVTSESALAQNIALPCVRKRICGESTGVLLPKRRMEKSLSREDIAAALRQADEYWYRTYGDAPPSVHCEMTDSTYSSGSGEEMAATDAAVSLSLEDNSLAPEHTWIDPEYLNSCSIDEKNSQSDVLIVKNSSEGSKESFFTAFSPSSFVPPILLTNSMPAVSLVSSMEPVFPAISPTEREFNSTDSDSHSDCSSSSTTEDSYEPDSDYTRLDHGHDKQRSQFSYEYSAASTASTSMFANEEEVVVDFESPGGVPQYAELPPLAEDPDEPDGSLPVKKLSKLTFSSQPIKMYRTYSADEYDRRNEFVNPLAAQAEYELEKRVDQLDQFKVELDKRGAGGLGLSILGVGLSDPQTGFECLNIYIKTITRGGGAELSKRLQVGDQLIEVNGLSLVGVTQAFAASALRNTSGLVSFVIGRARPAESDQQDIGGGTEEQVIGVRRAPSLDSEESNCSSGAVTDEMDSQVLLSKLKEAQIKLSVTEDELSVMRSKVMKLEQEELKRKATAQESDVLVRRLEDSEMQLKASEHMLNNYNSQLTQSVKKLDCLKQLQSTNSDLTSKYDTAKQLAIIFQQREKDLRCEYDTINHKQADREHRINEMIKALKDKVIELEKAMIGNKSLIIGTPAAVVVGRDASDGNTQTAKGTNSLQSGAVAKSSPADSVRSPTPAHSSITAGGSSTVVVSQGQGESLSVPHTKVLDSSILRSKAHLTSTGSLANRRQQSKFNSVSSDAGSIDERVKHAHAVSTNSEVDLAAALADLSTTNQLELLMAGSEDAPPVYAPPLPPDDDAASNISSPSSRQKTFEMTTKAEQAIMMRRESSSSDDSSVPVSDAEPATTPVTRSFDKPSLATSSTAGKADVKTLAKEDEELDMKRRSAFTKDVSGTNDKAGGDKAEKKGLFNIFRKKSKSSEIRRSEVLTTSRADVSRSSDPGQPNSERDIDEGQSDMFVASTLERSAGFSRGQAAASQSPNKSWVNLPVSQWDSGHVAEWLQAIGCPAAGSIFSQHGINGKQLLHIDMNKMKNMGVTVSKDRENIKKAVAELKADLEKRQKQEEREKKEQLKLEEKLHKAQKKAAKDQLKQQYKTQ